jgi:hypothetical protein
MPAISNTAATFFALWVGEKSAEFLKGRLIWLSIFGGSITLWQVGATVVPKCHSCTRQQSIMHYGMDCLP